MPSWVEDQARVEARIYRDGREVWRNLKLSVRQALDDYTRIYSPPGMQEVAFTDCQATTETVYACEQFRQLQTRRTYPTK